MMKQILTVARDWRVASHVTFGVYAQASNIRLNRHRILGRIEIILKEALVGIIFKTTLLPITDIFALVVVPHQAATAPRLSKCINVLVGAQAPSISKGASYLKHAAVAFCGPGNAEDRLRKEFATEPNGVGRGQPLPSLGYGVPANRAMPLGSKMALADQS